MSGLHWERLLAREPVEAAAAAGALLEGGEFVLPLLGRVLCVDPSRCSVRFEEEPERPVGYQRALVAVLYLAGALEAPPKGEWVAFRELPGGDAFFRGPHAVAADKLAHAYGRCPERLGPAAVALGGHGAVGADAAADLPALPRIGLRALLWAESPEFAARAALLVDARAHLHLPLDALWALSNLALRDLCSGS